MIRLKNVLNKIQCVFSFYYHVCVICKGAQGRAAVAEATSSLCDIIWCLRTSCDVMGHHVISYDIMSTWCPNLAHSAVAATIHGQYQPWPPVAATIHRHYQPRPTVAATINGQYQPRPPVGATIHGQYQPRLCSGSYNTWSISTSTYSALWANKCTQDQKSNFSKIAANGLKIAANRLKIVGRPSCPWEYSPNPL